MKILIVGGGLGGLTLAAFLKDSDVEYDIAEKAVSVVPETFQAGAWEYDLPGVPQEANQPGVVFLAMISKCEYCRRRINVLPTEYKVCAVCHRKIINDFLIPEIAAWGGT